MKFIAGLSPKKKTTDPNPVRCPVCGLQQAYYQRNDQYLALFSIPLLRIKKGEPFVMCEQCQLVINEYNRELSALQDETSLLCKTCGKPLDKGYSSCPYCGQRI